MKLPNISFETIKSIIRFGARAVESIDGILSQEPASGDALSFTAIDFETAHHHRGSVCSVGLARVDGGLISRTETWLIRPPVPGAFTFTHIHGITEQQVRRATTWKDSRQRIAEISSGTPLVAWNSSFDASVHHAANEAARLPAERLDYRDALVVVKRRHQLPSYKLPDVARHFDLPPFPHHDAAADARACAQIVLRVLDDERPATLDELWATKRRGNPAWRPSPHNAHHDNLPTTAGGPLAGEAVCFTGTLRRPRHEVQYELAELGAVMHKSVTLQTTLLVVGDFDPAVLRSGSSTSLKVDKAREYEQRGRPIRVVNEAELRKLVSAAKRRR